MQAARDNQLLLSSSVPLLHELTNILGRRKFRRKLELIGQPAEVVVEGYTTLLDTIVRPAAVPRIAPDPDDDIVIGTALAANAGSIVTGDKPFLNVGAHKGIRIISVAAALEDLGAVD
jgi:uncharacterized protein